MCVCVCVFESVKCVCVFESVNSVCVCLSLWIVFVWIVFVCLCVCEEGWGWIFYPLLFSLYLHLLQVLLTSGTGSSQVMPPSMHFTHKHTHTHTHTHTHYTC